MILDKIELLNLKDASLWASRYLGKKVTINNINYLLNYGRIVNHGQSKNQKLISLLELKNYYDTKIELDNPLSFANFKESETTKHIHRLHPYRGKFIPQLVEHFLKEPFFKKGDIVLDLFCGSGTTLAVANELGMHALGIELSNFNVILSNAKIKNYDLTALENETNKIINYLESRKIHPLETILNQKLSEFNKANFPHDFKRKVFLKEINELDFGLKKEAEFLAIYNEAVKGFDLNTKQTGSFLDKWYLPCIKEELFFIKDLISPLDDIFKIILSRTARSVRATTHSDLATLKYAIIRPYYCKKHRRICKPLFSVKKHFKRYALDTLKRLKEFKKLKTSTLQTCINADSTNCDVLKELQDTSFKHLIQTQKIAGIFTSPPYVGLIDYHEQHAYAYDLFNLARFDGLEIGSLRDGQGKSAQRNYVENIAKALRNVKPLLVKDYNIFIVANDKFDLYPSIADLADMRIAKCFDRPVLNRAQKDNKSYNESIFLLKEKSCKM
ncbi:DNA methyltransferase [Helicobacter suis]|uniref:DNA methyltransferase n=1 Tax=Helicobacter suis TaxID=104628 RepID=UPI0013D67796|nr:DNA methyltransferase [Helicobacter suis]